MIYPTLPPIIPTVPVVALPTVSTAPLPCKPGLPSATLLNQLFKDGKCAGNIGDFYQSQEPPPLHSPFVFANFPQVTDAAGRTLPPLTPVLGNCSYSGGGDSAHGEYNIPQANMCIGAYADANAKRLFQDYTSNRYAWYPGIGMIKDDPNKPSACYDRSFMLTAVVGTSEGRSGSDQKFLREMFAGLAAFRPEVKAKLREAGQLMPVLQYAMRRIRIASDADYLTALGHPSAFKPEGGKYDDTILVALIQFIQGITLETLPPFATLEIAHDDFYERPGIDFDDKFPEVIHTTPVSVSRAWRGSFKEKSIYLDATGTDSSGKPLTYQWSIVRGSSDSVRISSQYDDSSRVALLFTWKDGGSIVPQTNRVSTLSTVMLTVHNGVHYSPPAYINVYRFAGESRTYAPDETLLSMSQSQTDLQGQNWLPQPSFVSPRPWSKKIVVRDSSGKVAGWEAVTGKSAWTPSTA